MIDQQRDLALRARQGTPAAGPARGSPPWRPRTRRSGRSCRASARSCARRPSCSAAPGSPPLRRRARTAPTRRRRADSPRSPTPAHRRHDEQTPATARGRLVGGDRDVADRPRGRLLNDGSGMRALVRVDADDDHAIPLRSGYLRPRADSTSSRPEASLLSSHARDPWDTRRATEPRKSQPKRATCKRSGQPAAPPSQPPRSDDTATAENEPGTKCSGGACVLPSVVRGSEPLRRKLQSQESRRHS